MEGLGLPMPKKLEISCALLETLYYEQKWSVSRIAKFLKCSENKVNYWLGKCEIPKRTISEAIYNLKNPNGDPFKSRLPNDIKEAILFGLGLGLYWGEGLKKGKGGLRITNADPKLLSKFIDFLGVFFNVEKDRLRFGLQIFNDLSLETSIEYWIKKLGVKKEQFYKVVISKVRGKSTYKTKSKFGVIIIYFNNIKLKRLICEMIENI